MQNIFKKVFVCILVVGLLGGLIDPFCPEKVQAADSGLTINSSTGITLGAPVWGASRKSYTFDNVTTNFQGKKQKVFCISIDESGYFTAPIAEMTKANIDVTAVEEDGRYNSNVDGDKSYPLSDSRKLRSLTALGTMTDAQVQSFIKGMTFSRGSLSASTQQEISIISSEFDVEKNGATAMVVDGVLHFYKYIDWANASTMTYKDGTKVTVPASSVSKDSKNWTWYKAYELSKKEYMNGLQGYLATITSKQEQSFINNRLSVPTQVEIEDTVAGTKSTCGGAWIGGARTFAKGDGYAPADGAVFDADTMSELFPTKADNTLATLYRWMCGPEAGDVFTETNSEGKWDANLNKKYFPTGTWGSRDPWSQAPHEPDNVNSNKFKQEFCVQYGYTTSGEWNDWGPERSPYGLGNSAATGSGENGNSKAPMGFIVEFSAYDKDGDGQEEPGEVMSDGSRRDITIITAEPTLVSATIDALSFGVGKAVNITSVLGDKNTENGTAAEELISKSYIKYQWQISKDGGKTWTDISGATGKSYTPAAGDIGGLLRCHITAAKGNSDGYVGELYVSANSSDDSAEQVVGTEILAIAPVDLVFEKTNPKDLKEPLIPGKTVSQVTINGKTLTKGTDYTVSGTQLTFKKKYLNAQNNGVYPAAITYGDGTVQRFRVTVVDFDEKTVVKNPPMFKMTKVIIKGQKFVLNLQGVSKNAKVTYRSSKSKIASVSKKGVVKAKKVGKTVVTCTIVQNGAYYNVKVTVKVQKKTKKASKNYNLKKKALVKKQGKLPEFNIYKLVEKKKNTAIKFIKVAKNAKVKFSVKKSEKKILKVGKVKINKKKKTATCYIKGKKKGWAHLTCKIVQNGKTYYTRLFIRVNDKNWKTKQIKKYLK